jgi:leucyl-tRNA synthetase
VDVKIEGEGDARRAVHVTTGAPVTIGSIEKMSKSKHNTVDPEDIIDHYGADTIRWFMLSDSPPERDVQWTEAGVEGAWRFVQRLWRLMDKASDWIAPAESEMPGKLSEPALELRGASHRRLKRVSDAIESLKFNVAVAQVHEFTRIIEGVVGSPKIEDEAGIKWAAREACEIVIQMFGSMMPHLGEECWSMLGHDRLLAETPWPQADPALLVEDTVTIAVQVNGKRRDELTIARNAPKEDIEAAALKLENVLRAIEGRDVKKVIVVPQRIVNVVA